MNVTASCGAIALRPESDSAAELLRAVEQKLEEATRAGRNCVRA